MATSLKIYLPLGSPITIPCALLKPSTDAACSPNSTFLHLLELIIFKTALILLYHFIKTP
jgi:hypothetical protein